MEVESNAVDVLYQIAYKLDENQQFQGDEELFGKIIALSKSTKQTKQLSSQFFSKYFKRFPALQEKTIDSLIDLIEEDDIPIRVSALRAIPSICRDNPDYIAKLVDILAQLLNTDSTIEFESTKNSIIELYKLNSANTLNSILLSLESDHQKELMLKFLKERLMSLIKVDYRKSTLEAQSFFRERVLKLIANSKDTEIEILVELFKCFPKYQLKDAVVFCDTLIPLIESQKLVEMKKKVYFILGLLIKSASRHQESINCKVFDFYAKRVFPSLGELDETDKTEFLTLFSQITPLVNMTDASILFEFVFQLLKERIPVPAPADFDFKLIVLEALLIAFSNLGFKSPSQLRRLCAYKTNTGQPSDMAMDLEPARFDEFVARLRVLNERVGVTDAKLKKAIEVMPKSDPQHAQLVKTHQTTQNVITLVRQLSKNPPILQTNTIRPSYSKEPNQQKQLSKITKQFNQHHQQQQQNKQNSKPFNNQNNNNQNKPKQPKQQQSGKDTSNSQSPKSRFSPYVPPSLRRSGENNKNGTQDDSGDIQMSLSTSDRSKKPATFKGRGTKNYY